MGSSFWISACYGDVSTRNAGKVPFPAFLVPLRISGLKESIRAVRPIDFLFDSGACFCTIDRQLAKDRGIRFDEDLDRVKDGMSGLGGTQEAWLSTMLVRFPELDSGPRWLAVGKPRTTIYEFRFKVMIVEQLDRPLLGTGDLYRNFSVVSDWNEGHFFLQGDHDGERVDETRS